MDFEYVICFASDEQAAKFLKKVMYFVEKSEYITWADVLVLIHGDLSPDDRTSMNIGWTKEGFKVRRTGSKIELSNPDWTNELKPEPKSECSTNSPIHIVIDTSKLEYFDEAVECVLEHARTITDRTVLITIC